MEVSVEQLQQIVAASHRAFLQTNTYSLSRREANRQFGRDLIEKLETHNLLHDNRAKKIAKSKCRFLVSDIITAVELFDKM